MYDRNRRVLRNKYTESENLKSDENSKNGRISAMLSSIFRSKNSCLSIPAHSLIWNVLETGVLAFGDAEPAPMSVGR